MEERLGHMSGTPTLVLMSGSDEYVPKSVDQHALAARYAKHLGSDTPQSLQVRSAFV
jgi:DNA-binding response OmpR family regulator